MSKKHIRKEDADTLFFGKCEGKENNDSYNKQREYILSTILDGTFNIFLEDIYVGSKWKLLKESWKDVLDTIYKKKSTESSESSESYTSIKVKQKGGRACNYDFDVDYYNDTKKVLTITNVEFKYGGKSIDEIPQFFNADANKLFLDGYASWFYDNYVTKKAPYTNYVVPSKEVYMKEIYKNTSKNSFFVKLKEDEKEKEIYDMKSSLVKESITSWLETNHTSLNLEELSKEFLRSQGGKIFILWDKDTFHIDSFEEEQLRVSTNLGLNKQKNSILVNSKSNDIQYKMLLRWKNHLGILKPAWQISMARLLD